METLSDLFSDFRHGDFTHLYNFNYPFCVVEFQPLSVCLNLLNFHMHVFDEQLDLDGFQALYVHLYPISH